MRILITGAAGHIGANLLNLLKTSYDVIGIDNFSSYYSPEYKTLRVKSLEVENLIQNIDVRNYIELKEVISDFKPETVIHLAARPGVRAKNSELSEYSENNIQGFLNVIDLSKEFKVKKFIYASSSSVYTSDNETPFSEDSQLYYPKSFYALSKQSNEMAANYFASEDFNTIGLRFFTVYGPWGRPDMAVLQFLGNALTGQNANLNASLDTLRDFTFVDDVTLLIAQVVSHKGLRNSEILNVGGSTPRSLKELMSILEDSGLKLNFTHNLKSNEDIRFTNASIHKIAALGLTVPSIQLEEGIARTIKWIKSSNTDLINKVITDAKYK
jgi:UDP-glucuronate 4-epimerase